MQFIVPEKQSFHIGEEVIKDRSNTFRPVNINQTFTNEPVNLNHVIYFFKAEHSIGGGVFKLPQIVFVTATKDNNVAWTFQNET